VSWILCIDTAVQSSSICLLQQDKVVAVKESSDQKESASWLQVAIKELLAENDLSLQQLNAIAVSAGPGSYTGLRVGMASAKGLCYALQIPLIALNTLEVMASAVSDQNADLICPMIDARRMEVFTAVYTKELNIIQPPHPLILSDNSFEEELKTHSILFTGNGSTKFKPLVSEKNALFVDHHFNAASMAALAFKHYENKAFADIAYSEPYYGKEFQSPFFKSVI